MTEDIFETIEGLYDHFNNHERKKRACIFMIGIFVGITLTCLFLIPSYFL